MSRATCRRNRRSTKPKDDRAIDEREEERTYWQSASGRWFHDKVTPEVRRRLNMSPLSIKRAA